MGDESDILNRAEHHITIKVLFLPQKWVVSSVGLEHYLDRVGVTGSNPVQPTRAAGFLPSCIAMQEMMI